MLVEPRVILRTLNREVECDFQTVLSGRSDQCAEIVKRTQLRVNSIVPTGFAADCIRAAWIIRTGMQGVVRAFAVLPADRVNRREIEHVEAHVADRRQTLVYVVEGTVTVGVIGFRAGEQLVPAGKQCKRSLDLHRVYIALAAMLTWVCISHRRGGFTGQHHRDALVVQVRHAQAVQQIIEDGLGFALRALAGALKQQSSFFQLKLHWNAGGVLLRQLVTVGLVDIPPGFDHELV